MCKHMVALCASSDSAYMHLTKHHSISFDGFLKKVGAVQQGHEQAGTHVKQ